MVSFFEKLKKDTSEEKPKKAEKKAKKEWSALSEKTEGQLAIDVYQTDEEFVIQSTIAGIKSGDLDISIENEVLTIRGVRGRPDGEEDGKYFYQECYWGPFSRQIILPEEVDYSRAKATIKEGILTLRMPRVQKEKKKKITVEPEK